MTAKLVDACQERSCCCLGCCSGALLCRYRYAFSSRRLGPRRASVAVRHRPRVGHGSGGGRPRVAAAAVLNGRIGSANDCCRCLHLHESG